MMKEIIISALFLYGIIAVGASLIVLKLVKEEKKKMTKDEKAQLNLYIYTGLVSLIFSILIFIL